MENQVILILDDDPAIVSLLSDMLTVRGGYRIISASDSSEAVEKFNTHHENIVLVILDMNMPGNSGLEAFREMRKIKPTIHGLLITGSVKQDQISSALMEGIDGYLQKPFRMQELLQKVRSITEKKPISFKN